MTCVATKRKVPPLKRSAKPAHHPSPPALSLPLANKLKRPYVKIDPAGEASEKASREYRMKVTEEVGSESRIEARARAVGALWSMMAVKTSRSNVGGAEGGVAVDEREEAPSEIPSARE
jgi:hypothetical protein